MGWPWSWIRSAGWNYGVFAHIGVMGEEFSRGRLGPAAVRAFEVAVLDDRDGRVLRPADMVAVGVRFVAEIVQACTVTEQGAMAPGGGQQVDDPVDRPAGDHRQCGGGEDAHLGLLRLRSGEGERGDQQRYRESDVGESAALPSTAPQPPR